MMQTTDRTDASRPADQGFEAWLHQLPRLPANAERDRLAHAWAFACASCGQQRRNTGDRFIDHAVRVATVLAELDLDVDSLIAGLVQELPACSDLGVEAIAEACGQEVASLVEGSLRMEKLGHLHGSGVSGDAGERAEALRKMLLAMARDIRVVFLILADRLDDMRVLRQVADADHARIARETLDLHAPLANRLGIWQIKWELEDLAFRYLDPSSYQRIARLLAEKRVDRERFIDAMKARLERSLDEAGIEANVSGRPKHLYSIWRKMQRKGLGFHELFDLRAFRILVDTVPQCYAALGVVHSLWQPIPGEFDDYIASPKENNYQSLHTAVVGTGGRAVEVQIRTRQMHDQAELGIAAHWRYKEGRGEDPDFDARVAWLRKLLEAPGDGDEDFLDRFKAEVFEDRVYVITPQGDVIDLPRGSTPLDFAYTVHSQVGHRCRGARVNGRIVPLTRALQNGDQVEILTARQGQPSRDWLNPALGYLTSPRARSKVRAWFRQQDHDKNVETGRHVLERELHRLGLEDVNLEALAGRSRFPRLPEFLAAIGRGDITGGQIAGLLRDRLLPADDDPEQLKRHSRRRKTAGRGEEDIQIYGVGNLLTRIARCCQPAPGDSVIGFITRGEGVTIHRRDCRNVQRLEETSPQRLIDVSWADETAQLYAIDITVEAYDRRGLIRDISSLLNNEGINVTAVNTQTDPTDEVARMVLSVEVGDVGQLSRVVDRIAGLRNVRDVHRGH
ncbi:(p)ppGpp synthetase I SpoT/RelA [Spiribacter salinus M19-40]|uniref:GTP pyrophosphokinase n=1 Tax=Spiribacter salinus M19-40 TaxID=1260251 RepID=R4VLF6_9GAMM|nr:GTP diphosphokinase [Spiribacter salinus]AGM41277.1 (p)ppGpp synthetase I SpoT/RelA [Spiribacter salinus M19-40]MBY5268868.1 GTP diphosphokinase [Spiribacter salinus]